MTKLELLASELAFMSNDSLAKLARILVQDYPTRASSLEWNLSVEIQDVTIRQMEGTL
jgi:hypothetical protein